MQRLFLPLLNEVFMPLQCNYDLGNKFFERRRVRSVICDTESVAFLAPKVWEILSNYVSVTL